MSQKNIRNFSIIAHIDHGKTTLTDQILKITGTIDQRQSVDRILDSNPIEKERGITIKLAPVTMHYQLHNITYTLNLIDTPGHVDFSYEVSRSLAACEGALLLVDATQGIQAQTLAHASKAVDLGLAILPVINKIDLSSAQIEETQRQLLEIFGFRKNEIVLTSAKTGEGVEELLNRLIQELPAPKGKESDAPRILIFNSIYDQHLGVIVFVRVVDGSININNELVSLANQTKIEIKELGIFTPNRKPLTNLETGQVGYIATGLKDIRSLRVGDTLTLAKQEKETKALSGFKLPKPVVFADIYPTPDEEFNNLKNAVEQLKLTDASLISSQIHSPILGGGFRLGFLGLFHAEITQERLKREMGVETIITNPTVEYQVETIDGGQKLVRHPAELPSTDQIKNILEPITLTTVFTPREYLGSLMQLFQDNRGIYQDTHYFGNQAQLKYYLPLSELISGFVDKLKSVSQGFASLDYEYHQMKQVDALKLSVLINREPIESLSRIVVRQKAEVIGKEVVSKLKELLPRQLFAVPIQAAIGGKIIARETKPAARKDVTAKLYGGDRTRRLKLLEKQKKGKKKLAQLGKVNIPPETFTKLIKI